MIFFVLTNHNCKIDYNGKSFSAAKTPIFFDKDGVLTTISSYFMHKTIMGKDLESSIHTYANQMQTFLKFIHRLSVPWRKVSDIQLALWKGEMLGSQKSTSYVKNCLQTVFKFYEWAETQGHLHNHVAVYDNVVGKVFLISAKQSTKRKSWSWPHYPSADYRRCYTPTSNELELVHAKAFENSISLGTRDSLIMALYERTARRFEAANVTIQDIANWEAIDRYKTENRVFYIAIVGKGRKKRDLEITPETMELLREYLENERQAIVDAARKRNKKYVEPARLFLGQTTGLPLSLAYISRRISNLMASCGVNGTGHRIRAKGITDIVMAYDGFDRNGSPFQAEDVLIRAAEKSGHKNFDSLRPYLSLSRSVGIAAKSKNIEILRATDIKLQKALADLEEVNEFKSHFEGLSSHEKAKMLSDLKHITSIDA